MQCWVEAGGLDEMRDQLVGDLKELLVDLFVVFGITIP